MWPFSALHGRHWLLIALMVVFLFTYFGLLPWARVEESLESLAQHPKGAQVFHTKVDRADAIFITFMFVMLSPLALVAAAGVIAFFGAVLAAFLGWAVRVPGAPDWVFTLVVYLAFAGAAYFTRAVWLPQAEGFLSLLARAILAAYY